LSSTEDGDKAARWSCDLTEHTITTPTYEIRSFQPTDEEALVEAVEPPVAELWARAGKTPAEHIGQLISVETEPKRYREIFTVIRHDTNAVVGAYVLTALKRRGDLNGGGWISRTSESDRGIEVIPALAEFVRHHLGFNTFVMGLPVDRQETIDQVRAAGFKPMPSIFARRNSPSNVGDFALMVRHLAPARRECKRRDVRAST
jgi:hypothetical protein